MEEPKHPTSYVVDLLMLTFKFKLMGGRTIYMRDIRQYVDRRRPPN